MIQEIEVGDRVLKISLPRANDLGSTFREVFGSKDEYEFDSVIRPMLTEDDIVLDFGAHIGLFSLLVSQYVDTVHSFEPDKVNCEYMLRNIELNNIVNVLSYSYALAGQDGQRDFLISCKSPACNSFFEYPFFNDNGESAVVRKVDCVTLEEAFICCDIDFCKLIKMDIEGAEFEVLLDLPKHMFERIGIFILEVHNQVTEYTEQDITKKLEENGFDTVVLFGTGEDEKEFMSLRAINKEKD